MKRLLLPLLASTIFFQGCSVSEKPKTKLYLECAQTNEYINNATRKKLKTTFYFFFDLKNNTATEFVSFGDLQNRQKTSSYSSDQLKITDHFIEIDATVSKTYRYEINRITGNWSVICPECETYEGWTKHPCKEIKSPKTLF